MTDKEKLEAIKAEIERLRKVNKVSEDKEYAQYELDVKCGYDMALDDMLPFVNSLSEEPISEQNLSNVERTVKNWKEESVSEELWEAAQIYYEELQKEKFEGSDVIDAFKAGAQWQKEQFEKNRLKHCDSITNEQAELEQGFIDQHLDKYQRMPTFLDAVEYGMRLQKEQKDNELTWEDIPEILRISEQLKTSWWFRDNEQTKQIGTQVFWEEVLKRFKAIM